MPQDTISFCSAALEGPKPAKEPSGNFIRHSTAEAGRPCLRSIRKEMCIRDRSLLYNLIDNAVKASQSGTCVTLNAYFTQDGVMEFSVADQGSGIPKEELDKIFEPFYRVDKARSRKYGGAGLGLALCMEIAHAHAATLEIESEVGRGTVIRLRFDGKGKGSVL